MKHRIAFIGLFLSIATLLMAGPMEDRYWEVRAGFLSREKSAQQDLKQYLEDYPYTTYRSEVQLMIGVLQTEKEKYKRAQKSFADVVCKELDREDQPLYYFYRGYVYIQQGDLKSATSLFRALKDSQNPYTLQGKYYYAYCLYRQGEYSKALPSFLEIENTAQYHQIVPYYIIQIYYAQQNYDEVFARAEDLLRRNPKNENNAEVQRILGELYYVKGNYAKAEQNLHGYDSAYTARKQEVLRTDLYLLGVARCQNGNYAKAISSLKRVKQLNDSISENTCLHMGNAYRHLGELEQAKLAYAAAANFRITPSVREEAMYNYALATYEINNATGESVKAFNDFLHDYPNTKHATSAYQLLANVYMNCKNYTAALDAVNAIPQQTPQLTKIQEYLRYQIGVDCFLQGKMSECERSMTMVIEKAKTNSSYTNDAYYYRAEARYRMHQYEACYNDLKTFLSLPNNQSTNLPMVDYLMGYAQFSLKQYSEAEVAFRRFTAGKDPKTPMYADAMNRIGDCCFNNRAFDAALAAYQPVADSKGPGADYATFQMGYAKGLQRHYAEKADLMEQLVASFPKSDYADDALYEIARARLQDEQNEDAINAYSRLIEKYPNSNLARKSALERGMIYRNIRQYPEAIAALQYTIDRYPGSEESFAALDALEQIYVETNRVTEYLAYTKTLDNMHIKTSGQEDSLTYTTAELQYMLGNYKDAAAGMTTYLSQFCAGGRYCTLAAWYAADCYYRMENVSEAIEMYRLLQDIPGNPYAEETVTRLAELLFEQKDYAAARTEFQNMQTLVSSPKDRTAAQLGELRCAFFLEDDSATIAVATMLLSDPDLTDEVRDEALYNRGKAYYRATDYAHAIKDFAVLSKNVRVVTGAESSYLLADCYFRLEASESAESEIMRLASSNTQHQYWLAKSLILLADINTKRGELFQAKQYLLSLQTNYTQQDDILSIVSLHLEDIAHIEQAQQEAEQAAAAEQSLSEDEED